MKTCGTEGLPVHTLKPAGLGIGKLLGGQVQGRSCAYVLGDRGLVKRLPACAPSLGREMHRAMVLNCGLRPLGHRSDIYITMLNTSKITV